MRCPKLIISAMFTISAVGCANSTPTPVNSETTTSDNIHTESKPATDNNIISIVAKGKNNHRVAVALNTPYLAKKDYNYTAIAKDVSNQQFF